MTSRTRNSEPQQEFKIPPAFKYQEGEKVLCFHGPLIYEAKCLQSRYDATEKVNQYHIHYSGWNKNWDEWVPETRVLKYNDQNILRQEELHKAQKAEPKGKKGKKRSVSGKEKGEDGKERDAEDSRSSTPVNEKGSGGKGSASASQSSSQESASDIPKRKRSKLDPSVETTKGKVPSTPTLAQSASGEPAKEKEEHFLSKVEIKIKMPDELKPRLLDDWENIVVKKKWVKTPSAITAQEILDAYLKQKVPFKSLTPNKESARKSVVLGIKDYFNAMLGPQLLYNQERPQYNEVVEKHPREPMSSLYGGIHLLRLFVRLGRALAYTRLDEKTVQLVLTVIHDFLKFLHRRAHIYLSPESYIPAA
ncbi:Mortality factor 4-like protein [Nesidiocoris tenuis]|uniref:Mortality factor 4-like protein n=2 Tax=Nesidiocoris tenuis TaxID=355587 RepID=A0ABN7AA58_9HEMI|nr:Mortality factor 4-like protein [Nesidiocoris tenuis]